MMDVDPEVVRACQRGEPGALDALIRATYADVFNLALRLVRDREDAADVTQEVFVRVLRSVAGFRGESSFGTWLHRVTVNVALTSMRRRARRPMLGRQALGAPGTSLVPLEPEIAIESARLPGEFHGDSADRILVATSRVIASPL